jgi:RHS repeat-associated protein
MTAKGSNTYRYDELRRLIYADEVDWTEQKRGEEAGAAVEDFTGQGELVFKSGEVELKLDRASTSIGAELGTERDLVGVELHPTDSGHRVQARTVEVWVRSGKSYQKVSGAKLSVTADGTLKVVFDEPVITSAVKLHCLYDERDVNDQARDLAEFKNTDSKLLVVRFRLRRQQQSYSYDNKGNRVGVTRTFADAGDNTTASSTVAYWPSSDRVKSYSGWTYVYDAKGRLVEKGTEYTAGSGFATSSGQYVDYEWDLFDRLEVVRRSEAGTNGVEEAARYQYDADGLRVQKTAGAELTRWVYEPDGNPVVEQTVSYVREFVYAESKLLGYWQTLGGEAKKYYTLTDQVGSVVSTTDELGVEVSKRDYMAFGGEAGLEGELATSALYTGKEWDEEIRLYYFNARWYDPELGRFISEDPIMHGPNWYAYVANSPLMKTDPTGLFDPDDPNLGRNTRSVLSTPIPDYTSSQDAVDPSPSPIAPSPTPVPIVSRAVAGLGAQSLVPATVLQGEELYGRAFGHFGEGYTAYIPTNATMVDCTQFTAYANKLPVVGSGEYETSRYYTRVESPLPGDIVVWRATSPSGKRKGHAAIFTGLGGEQALLHAFQANAEEEGAVVYTVMDLIQAAYNQYGYSDVTIQYYRPRLEQTP